MTCKNCERLEYYLKIHLHAHHSGNAVPPHLDKEAREALQPTPEKPCATCGGSREIQRLPIEIYASEPCPDCQEPEVKEDTAYKVPYWTCSECGPGVAADEDGCCANCGADCKEPKERK